MSAAPPGGPPKDTTSPASLVMVAVGAALVSVLLAVGAAWLRTPAEAPSPERVDATISTPGAPTSAPAPGPGARRTPSRGGPTILIVDVRRQGQAVANAEVLLLEDVGAPAGTPPVARGRTEADGIARFPLPPRPVLVGAREGAVSTTPRRVVASADEAELTLTLELGAVRVIQGRVLAEDTKAPVAGAALVFAPQVDAPEGAAVEDDAPPELGQVGKADGLGRFSLSVAEGEGGTVTASAPGYVPTTERLPQEPGGADVTLSLARAGRVEGLVVDAAGRALAGVPVRAQPSTGQVATTDPAGAFTLEAPPGRVTLEATSATGRHALERVEVRAGEVTRGVRLVVADGAPVEGLVRAREGGAPVADAEVALSSEPDGVELARATTGAEGRFHFAEIPRGRWQLHVRAGRGGRGDRVGLEVPLAGPLVIEVTAPAALAGHVVDEGKQPVAGAVVRVEWAPGLGEGPRTVRTDATGSFRVDDLLPAEVLVSASSGDRRSPASRTWVGPGAVATLELSLRAKGRLVGRVEGPGGPWRITASDESQLYRTTTDATGNFSFELPAGRYAVACHELGGGVWLARDVEVDVPAGNEVAVSLRPAKAETDRWQELRSPPETGVSFDRGPGGVFVSFLMGDSPAFAAGVRQGDLVQSLDGVAIHDVAEAFVRAKGTGGPSVAWVVRRGGADHAFTVTGQ